MTGWQGSGPAYSPQPPGQRRPIEGRRVAIGVAIAIGAHLLTLAAIPIGSLFQDGAILGAFVFLALQGLLFLTLLVVGIVLTVRQDGGIGVGLLIGWALGVLVSFGGCVALLNLTA
ncbi:MAG TPA: hypothetical protein VFO77_04720 [Actinoplanes sp.]|nr:hypothetical protein [Actinoplanes sp.]